MWKLWLLADGLPAGRVSPAEEGAWKIDCALATGWAYATGPGRGGPENPLVGLLLPRKEECPLPKIILLFASFSLSSRTDSRVFSLNRDDLKEDEAIKRHL